VPLSLTVCTLRNIPFVFGWFEFYFALLYLFYIEYVLGQASVLQKKWRVVAWFCIV
jgi:hypothetical protein